jgi:hypothetical protein
VVSSRPQQREVAVVFQQHNHTDPKPNVSPPCPIGTGMESRRVYVLEHAGEYVRSHALKPEDVIGISTTEDGSFLIEYNTDEVCNAAETQAAARPGQVRQGTAP